MRPIPLLFTLSAAVPLSARAQLLERPPSRPQDRASGGVGLTYAQPLGAFRNYVQYGFGAAGNLVIRLDRQGIVGLRVDGGYVNYGSETKRVRLTSTIGDRIRVDVNTTNNIAALGIGPQLMVPRGRVRPYVNGSVGFSYFFTESSVEGSNDSQQFASTTNFDDGTMHYAAGGGVVIPFRVKTTPVALDVGARYLNNRRTRYLREGGITDQSDGSITINPIQSRVELVAWSVGVTIGRK